MSDAFICVRSAVVLACLLVLSHSYPIGEQEPTLNRYDEKQGNEISTTERDVTGGGDHFSANVTEDDHFDTLLSRDESNVTSKAERTVSPGAVPLIGNGEQETEGSKKENSKRNACHDNASDRRRDDDDDDEDDDDDDDDDDNEREERGKVLLRSFEGVYERAKRGVDSTADSEGERATRPESDFVDHVLDYSLDRKKREQDGERETAAAIETGKGESPERKRRQSGETVPYITPNRSRREEGSESVDQEAEQPGRRINEGEEKEEMEEEEEEEEEDKKEELVEKLAMES